MSVLKETIFANRNNTIRLLLAEDDQLFHVAYPAVTPTRWVFTIHAATPIIIDSNTVPAAFNWGASTSILELKLGSIVTTALAYTSSSLVMYSSVWPQGMVWVNPTCSPDRLQIRVCDIS